MGGTCQLFQTLAFLSISCHSWRRVIDNRFSLLPAACHASYTKPARVAPSGLLRHFCFALTPVAAADTHFFLYGFKALGTWHRDLTHLTIVVTKKNRMAYICLWRRS